MTSFPEVPLTSDFENWHNLYIAALFESDEEKLSERIHAAEKAVLDRKQQLSLHNGFKELSAIEACLKTLTALRGCACTASATVLTH